MKHLGWSLLDVGDGRGEKVTRGVEVSAMCVREGGVSCRGCV